MTSVLYTLIALNVAISVLYFPQNSDEYSLRCEFIYWVLFLEGFWAPPTSLQNTIRILLSTTAMVEIYLKVDETKIPFLSVPDRDTTRLAIRPFKWLRFVMFCICGARGELHAMSDDSIVDYNSTTIADHVYWYKPRGKVSFFLYVRLFTMNTSSESCIFVDHHGLDEKITTTTLTPRRHAFRDDALQRDAFCVATGEPAQFCDATHLAPKSKGDDVTFVIILCDSSIIFCSSTFRRFSTIVLLVITPRLQFPGLTIFRTVCCWPRPCMRSSPTDLLPS